MAENRMVRKNMVANTNALVTYGTEKINTMQHITDTVVLRMLIPNVSIGI